MSRWSYQVETAAGSLIGNLDTLCSAVFVANEGQGGGKKDSNLDVPQLSGERWEDKPEGPADITLVTVLKYGAGESKFMEDLDTLHSYLGHRRPRYLVRTNPKVGKQRARFERLVDPVEGADANVYVWVLRSLDGSWQDYNQSTATGNPPSVTTGGNRDIFDPEIEFSAAGTFKYTDSAGEEYEIKVDSGPAFPVTIRNIGGEWEAVDNNGAAADQYVTALHPAVMVFEYGSNLSITTTVACTVRWRNRRA